MKITTSDIDGAVIGVRCVKNINIRTRNLTLSSDDVQKLIESEAQRIIIKAEKGRYTIGVIDNVELALQYLKNTDKGYFLLSYHHRHPYASEPGDE